MHRVTVAGCLAAILLLSGCSDRELRIVAFAICSADVPEEQFSHTQAKSFHRHWVNRPNVDLCIEYAKEIIEEQGLIAGDDYAKIYCVKAETFAQSETSIVRE
jgi:hypothetical protein